MKFRWFFCIIVILMIVPVAYSATVFVDPNTQVSPLAGKTISLNIKAKDVADLLAYQFELGFDKTAIKLVSVEEGDFLKSNGVSTLPLLSAKSGKSVAFKDINADILLDVNNTGALTLANLRYGKDNLGGVDGAGTLVGLKFEVIEAKESKVGIKNAFGDPKLNPVLVNSNSKEIIADLLGGTITQPPLYVKGDVNNNGSIQSNDAILVLRISAELLIPDEQQLYSADMNNDGVVRSNDAIAILRKVVGLGAPDKTPIVKDVVSVRLDNINGIAGQTITVPLKIDGSGIVAGGDISIAYDSSVLNVVEISSDPDTIMVINTANSGIIKIAFVGSSSNTLAEIKFNV
ncbi:MAG: cohesin domain-containing protein, partial [Candidatus Poribacteria bacterium]